MITVAAGVKAMPAYVPPKDGKPRNQVDAKWMKLTKASSGRTGVDGLSAFPNDKQQDLRAGRPARRPKIRVLRSGGTRIRDGRPTVYQRS